VVPVKLKPRAPITAPVVDNRAAETKKHVVIPRQWNDPESNLVFGSIDAVALITSKTLQPWRVCARYPGNTAVSVM
jgi:hypothetical protein